MMESVNLKIRFLEEKDIDEVNNFHNRLHQDDRSRIKFNWEFHDAPAGKAIYIVAEDVNKKRIVGTQCAIPIMLRSAGGKTLLSAKSEDTLVDPEYRGMQIFEKMYDLLFESCKEQGLNYIWGFTSALKPFTKIGFELPYSHCQSLMVLKVRPAFHYLAGLNPKNSAREKFKIYALVLLSRLNPSKIRPRPMGKGIRVQTSSKVSTHLNGMIDSTLNTREGFFTFDETPEYIDWRINRNPYHDRVFSVDFYKNENFIGNIIFNHHTGGVWYMIQSLFDEQLPDSEKAYCLGTAVKKLIEAHSPVLIRTWNFTTNPVNDLEIKLLKRAGFVFLSRGVYFVWKDLKGSKDLDPHHFILSRIASQGVI